jgi:hypothetical protein
MKFAHYMKFSCFVQFFLRPRPRARARTRDISILIYQFLNDPQKE